MYKFHCIYHKHTPCLRSNLVCLFAHHLNKRFTCYLSCFDGCNDCVGARSMGYGCVCSAYAIYVACELENSRIYCKVSLHQAI